MGATWQQGRSLFLETKRTIGKTSARFEVDHRKQIPCAEDIRYVGSIPVLEPQPTSVLCVTPTVPSTPSSLSGKIKIQETFPARWAAISARLALESGVHETPWLLTRYRRLHYHEVLPCLGKLRELKTRFVAMCDTFSSNGEMSSATILTVLTVLTVLRKCNGRKSSGNAISSVLACLTCTMWSACVHYHKRQNNLSRRISNKVRTSRKQGTFSARLSRLSCI
jgi:hypothetical protein